MTVRHTLLIFLILASAAVAQEEDPESKIADLERRIQSLESEQSRLRNRISSKSQDLERKLNRLKDEMGVVGVAFFLSGILCALWAQYTRRSAWLWFFFGLVLGPIALIALVWKNALGLESGALRRWTDER